MRTLLLSTLLLLAVTCVKAQPPQFVNIVGTGYPCPLTLHFFMNDGTPPLCLSNCDGQVNIPPNFTGPLVLPCSFHKPVAIRVFESGGGGIPATVITCPTIGPPGSGTTPCFGPLNISAAYSVPPFHLDINIY